MVFLSLNCAKNTEPFYGSEDDFFSIRYEITGSATVASVAFINENLKNDLSSRTPIPWTYQFSQKKSKGTYLYISAQHLHQDASLTVTIYKNNSVFKSNTKDGQYAKVEAFGRI